MNDKIGYEYLDADFYDKLTESPNPVRRFFHNKRYEILRYMVRKHYRPGMRILDVGGATSTWNKDKIPVIGLDINKRFLEYALKKGRITGYIFGDVFKEELGKNHIIIASEFLEHIETYPVLLGILKYSLKKNGVLIVTVPYDTGLSLWRYLFGLQCFLYGRIMGLPYYRNNGGHVNHFSPYFLKWVLERAGFRVLEEYNFMRLTITIIAELRE